MMLADFPSFPRAGTLAREVLLPDGISAAFIEFIAGQLPMWRDDPNRKKVTQEDRLTYQLCVYLTTAARMSKAWDWVQFQSQVPDELKPNRTIDIAPSPCLFEVVIAGRRYTQGEILLPIERKRLPTPNGKKDPTGEQRDEREYVVSATSSTGGIQRFKFGHHSSMHRQAAMIGYIQEQTIPHWFSKINGWIRDLCAHEPAWSSADELMQISDDHVRGICHLSSRHERVGTPEAIDLQHIWIEMN